MTERLGRVIFAFAIVAIGVPSLIWAKASVMLVRGHPALPIMPYPPAIPRFAILLGIAMIICGFLVMREPTARLGAVSFAVLFLLSALIFGRPRVATHIGNSAAHDFLATIDIGRARVDAAGRKTSEQLAHYNRAVRYRDLVDSLWRRPFSSA